MLFRLHITTHRQLRKHKGKQKCEDMFLKKLTANINPDASQSNLPFGIFKKPRLTYILTNSSHVNQFEHTEVIKQTLCCREYYLHTYSLVNSLNKQIRLILQICNILIKIIKTLDALSRTDWIEQRIRLWHLTLWLCCTVWSIQDN